ncbi:50S ribosomal protein L22 [Patescibacteria group bacterium]|nr:50S ribosomal protein L22 [Patescibacteria group bacterium]
MQVIAKLKNLRIAPRKVRLVANLVRGKKLNEAQALLNFSFKKAVMPMKKLFDQGLANAENNFQLDKDSLYISEIKVDEGQKLKRWRARAKGRAAPIQKKRSHITLILEGEKMEAVKADVSPIEAKPLKPKESVKNKLKFPKKEKAKFAKPKKKIGLKREYKRKAF